MYLLTYEQRQGPTRWEGRGQVIDHIYDASIEWEDVVSRSHKYRNVELFKRDGNTWTRIRPEEEQMDKRLKLHGGTQCSSYAVLVGGPRPYLWIGDDTQCFGWVSGTKTLRAFAQHILDTVPEPKSRRREES